MIGALPRLSRRVFLAGSATAGLSAQARRPNIVIILADDLGHGECGFQGMNGDIPTPNIDSISSNGVRFTQAYVSAPYCFPSRAGLMTGRYQTRFGHEMNVVGVKNNAPGIGLPLSEKTMAGRLKAAGYSTACVGKWHLGGQAEYHPQRRGFDEFFGFLHEGHFYYPPPFRGAVTRLRTNEPPYDEGNPVMRGSDPIEETAYLTDAFAREATAFIDRQSAAARPFFLYLPFNAIHSPMQAPVPLVRAFPRIQDEQRRLFAAMLAAMDRAVGVVLAKLRERGLENDTLIFFLSDNGGPAAELTSSNAPLRGGKGQLWEGGIRVPFCLQWKGRIQTQTFEQPVIALDILPTALAAAGASAAPGLDGRNLIPYLTGQAVTGPPHTTLFWRYGRNIALRKGKYKLLRQSQPQGDGPFQLFDLTVDQTESSDLSSALPDVAAELRRDMEQLNAAMKPPLW